MKKLNSQRFILGLVSIAGLIAAGIGIFVTLGLKISIDAVAVGLLTLLIRELGGGKTTAFAWFFDGSADNPPPAPGTTLMSSATTTAPTPAPTNALDAAKPTGTANDPVSVTETKP